MLVVLSAFVQPLDDPAEAFDRHGARTPLQCVHAEASDSHNKVVRRRPQVRARQEPQEGVVDGLAAVLCIRVEEVIHQPDGPRYPREPAVQGSIHCLRRHGLDGPVKTLPCEHISFRHTAGSGQPRVKEGQTGLSASERRVSLAGQPCDVGN
jgi:hypothetical protein